MGDAEDDMAFRCGHLVLALSRQARTALALFVACVFAACEPGDPAGNASAELNALLDGLWEHSLETDVLARAERGLPVTALPPVSFAAAEQEAAFQREMMTGLLAVDRDGLSLPEQLTLDATLWESSMALEGLDYFWLNGFLTPYASPLRTLGALYPSQPLSTQEQADAYLALAGKLPEFINDLEERARGQVERGIAVSQANLPNVVAMWRAQAVPAEESVLWPGEERTEQLRAPAAMAFRAQLAQILEEEVGPAYRSLAAYLEGPYSEVAPEGVGVAQYPGGREYYQYLTRLNTTMRVSPEQVQEAGRELLGEFRREMTSIRGELGFEGTREEFHAMLRTDPRFFPKTPEEVEERLTVAAEAMWVQIHDYFQVTQEAPYGARRLRADLEPTMTYGYYSSPSDSEPTGYYNFNGSQLDERSWIGLAAIGLHELIPGHHFQIARQLENESLHELRRGRRHTAFTEGWGSYSSFLGLEAGVFDDPYSRYGLYALESFLATRLVVDPGMNFFDMTLDEAREFMRDNTLESETQIATESLRYSTDIPGQALGYQMGKRMFMDLRRGAEDALGDGFDLPAFHEALMENGSLPMIVLERRIGQFIEDAGGEEGN